MQNLLIRLLAKSAGNFIGDAMPIDENLIESFRHHRFSAEDGRAKMRYVRSVYRMSLRFLFGSLLALFLPLFPALLIDNRVLDQYMNTTIAVILGLYMLLALLTAIVSFMTVVNCRCCLRFSHYSDAQ